MSNNEDNMFSLDRILKDIDHTGDFDNINNNNINNKNTTNNNNINNNTTNNNTTNNNSNEKRKLQNKKGNKINIRNDTQKNINMDNYIEIPKEEWNTIPLNTYIRYKENNTIQQGGKIINVTSNTSITITLYIYTYRKHVTKTILFSDITAIYKFIKKDNAIQSNEPQEQTSSISQLGDKILFNNNETLKEEIDILKKEIENLKSHITRIDENTVSLIKMIKKIHKQNTDH
jgi:hypothetical protein